MNKIKFKYLLCAGLLGILMCSSKAEATLEGQGTLKSEEIIQLNEDKETLETEIQALTDSVSGNQIIQTSKRKELIKSKGNINFDHGKVMIKAEDLVYLANEIDQLETGYKSNLIDALNQIGIYFRKDGSFTYNSNRNEIDTEELKTSISLGSILQGIMFSQSVDTIKQLQVVDGEGNPLFYQSEEAKNNKDHLEVTTTDTGFPVYYTEATADNLSAGCAAWINGVLLKGNGEDNKKSWDNGYKEGYSEGVAESLNKGNIVYTYHKHTGQNGACYGPLTGVRPKECGCEFYAYTTSLPGYEGIASCGNCGHNHPDGTCRGNKGYESYTYIGLVCGKTEQTIESATIVY